jgi:hypothetical protein
VPIAVNSQGPGKSEPPGTGRPDLGSPIFYDVRVEEISDGTATVSITNEAVVERTETIWWEMKYWADGKWVDAGNQSVKGHTINGDIPVRSLNRTPIAIGTR